MTADIYMYTGNMLLQFKRRRITIVTRDMSLYDVEKKCLLHVPTVHFHVAFDIILLTRANIHFVHFGIYSSTMQLFYHIHC